LPKVSLRVLSLRFGVAVALAVMAASIPVSGAVPAATTGETAVEESLRADRWPSLVVDEIGDRVFDLALAATRCASKSGDIEHPSTLTVIDYSKPSTEPRLWVVDLQRRALLYEELVAHGQGSGANLATKFSNVPDSHQSSLGLFVTEDAYIGKNGYSLRLTGLEAGVNDRAHERAIVIHGAPYVNDTIAKDLGRLGRSHGCPAVRSTVARELIDRVKQGSVVFAYYPDEDWLTTSKYLDRCSAEPRASRGAAR
jgi:hypothetical protein